MRYFYNNKSAVAVESFLTLSRHGTKSQDLVPRRGLALAPIAQGLRFRIIDDPVSDRLPLVKNAVAVHDLP